MQLNYISNLLQQWSFGVTCWEVFTCGGVPYAGVPATTLCSELKSGHRLDRPSNLACSDDMYVVRDCVCVCACCLCLCCYFRVCVSTCVHLFWLVEEIMHVEMITSCLP